MFLVTGGAGFIGSNIVASLNEAGATDVAVSDWLGQGDVKWCNLAKRQIADFVPPADLARWLEGRRLDGVIHMGAISDTTATDGDAVMDNNFRLSLKLLDWCTHARTPFFYASSAATYGNGEEGFTDGFTPAALRKAMPTASELRTLLWAGLQEHHPEVVLKDAGRMCHVLTYDVVYAKVVEGYIAGFPQKGDAVGGLGLARLEVLVNRVAVRAALLDHALGVRTQRDRALGRLAGARREALLDGDGLRHVVGLASRRVIPSVVHIRGARHRCGREVPELSWSAATRVLGPPRGFSERQFVCSS